MFCLILNINFSIHILFYVLHASSATDPPPPFPQPTQQPHLWVSFPWANFDTIFSPNWSPLVNRPKRNRIINGMKLSSDWHSSCSTDVLGRSVLSRQSSLMSRLSLSTAQVDTITGSITCGEGEKYDSPLNSRMDSSHIVYFHYSHQIRTASSP